MATKTIPQLTLRASLTDSSMFEIDDGIQSYRITALQVAAWLQTQNNLILTAMITDANVTAVKLASDAVTTAKILNLAVTAAKLDESFVHDLTAVTPVAADYLALADASDSNKKKKAKVSDIRNAVYRSVTGTDNVGVDDETLKLSSSSFTLTLPTAAGVTGKRYKIIHGGTSFSQVYTLATTSAQTIGGVASGSYSLYTNGEVLEIQSDGSNWIIVGRVSTTGRIAYTPTYTGFGTVTVSEMSYRRQGSLMFIEGTFETGTVTGVEARISLPSTAITTPTQTASLIPVGSIIRSIATSGIFFLGLRESGKSYLTLGGAVTNSIAWNGKRLANAVFGNGDLVSVLYQVPIAEFQP